MTRLLRQTPHSPVPGPVPSRRSGGSSPEEGSRWHRLTRGSGPWAGLLALCLVLFLPGMLTLPPFDRDEARFAQASRQMLESGDYIRISFQHEPRNKKPIGIYWAQAASAHLFGGDEAPIGAYRLPSALAATAAVLLLFAGLRRQTDPATAFLAASLLAATLLTVVEAHLAKTDAALLACTVGAQMALLRAYRPLPDEAALPLRYTALFWGALGAAILVKGPVVPMVVGVTLLALGVADKSWGWLKRLRPLMGLPLAALIVAPWTLAILAQPGGGSTAAGGNFFVDAIRGDLLPKLIGSQEGHGAPPGLYLALLAVTFFPGTLLLIPALRAAWKTRLDPLVRFALAWVLPCWLIFELIPTKLPHYVLPLYPALALLVARFALTAVVDQVTPWSARISQVLWGLVALLLATVSVGIGLYFDQALNPLAVIAAAVFLIGGGLTLRWVWIGAGAPALVSAITMAALGYGVLLSGVLPASSGFFLSRSLAAQAEVLSPGARLVAAGYAEPSLVFLTQTTTRLTDAETAAQLLADRQADLALIGDRDITKFREAAEAAKVPVEALSIERGYNYSKGRWVTVTFFRRAG
ncbi:glycosyltransferase family 39 protein [Elstera sp.]|uniref:glycosyltransferase family 39 protein n=1 Tax=Elstera sp. TaxID=1916664 RepID=UPI0037C0EE3E